MGELSVACGRSTLESEQCYLGVHQMRIAGTNCYLPTLPNNLYPATARLSGIATDEAPDGIGSRLDGVLPTGAGPPGAAIFREMDLLPDAKS